MRRSVPGFLIAGLLFGARVKTCAIATADDTISAQNPTNYGYSLDWNYIYKYKGSSSVAVDHYWILTAAHVADDASNGNLMVDGETYNQREIVFHPTADLALVRFDKPFPGYYPLHDGEIHNGKSGPQRVWDPLVLVGYGYPGTVTAITFTQNGIPGIKRWGTNRGTGESSINTNVGGSTGDRTTQCFSTSFTLVDTPYEAGGNTFDSGGSFFIEQDSKWKLAGINLYRIGSNPYTGNYAALIPNYISWIKSVIVDYDTDTDGLPDWWETLYAESATSMETGADPDGDGFSNYMEWIADTVPTNANSFFSMGLYTNVASLSFTSSTNREYQILFRTDLSNTNETWQTEGDWFVGSHAQTVQSVSVATSNRFYNVRGRLR